MDFRIVIVLYVVLGLFMGFPDRFGRKRFENWFVSKEPKPYVLNVLYFSLLGWMIYKDYKDIGEEIGFGSFLSIDKQEVFPFFLLLYLTLLGPKGLDDKKDKSNRIDYFKNKQQHQKEWIEKSM